MKKEKFIAKVQKELAKIKKLATPEELAKLKFKMYDPNDPSYCIYGLMTGNAGSDRAKVFKKKQFQFVGQLPNSGKDSRKFEDHSFDKGEKFTALEKFLMMVEGKKEVKGLFKYLKGKTETINLDLI
jgi:hypothetical protein